MHQQRKTLVSRGTITLLKNLLDLDKNPGRFAGKDSLAPTASAECQSQSNFSGQKKLLSGQRKTISSVVDGLDHAEHPWISTPSHVQVPVWVAAHCERLHSYIQLDGPD